MLGFCPQLVEEPFPPYGQLRVCFSFISSFSDVNQWCGRGAVRGAETACVYVCVGRVGCFVNWDRFPSSTLRGASKSTRIMAQTNACTRACEDIWLIRISHLKGDHIRLLLLLFSSRCLLFLLLLLFLWLGWGGTERYF